MKENKSAMQPPQYPRQEIAAVEKFIQENDGQFTQPELWSQLSEKISHQTFDFVIGFLLYRQKIAADELGVGKLASELVAGGADEFGVFLFLGLHVFEAVVGQAGDLGNVGCEVAEMFPRFVGRGEELELRGFLAVDLLELGGN